MLSHHEQYEELRALQQLKIDYTTSSAMRKSLISQRQAAIRAFADLNRVSGRHNINERMKALSQIKIVEVLLTAAELEARQAYEVLSLKIDYIESHRVPHKELQK